MKNKKIIFMGTPQISAEYLNSLIKHNIKTLWIISTGLTLQLKFSRYSKKYYFLTKFEIVYKYKIGIKNIKLIILNMRIKKYRKF